MYARDDAVYNHFFSRPGGERHKQEDSMRRNAGHYVLGTEGLALLRTWLVADDETLRRRVDELARMAGAPDEPPMSIALDVPELEVQPGYERWATSYDEAPNPLIRVEEPVVRALIDRVPPARALDAACGTGRHTAYLASRGHRVAGVDATAEMLAKARVRVPGADLRQGDLARLPFEDGAFELAVCALALSHLPDPAPAIAELARVLRHGGTLVLSDLHPTMLLLGGTAFFVDASGLAGNVRSFHHPHGRYLAAFRATGLVVDECVEPALGPEDVAAMSGGLDGFAAEAFRTAWVGMPNALVWSLVRQ
jgi:SAM-dependent methyltransferase